ncbi:hypothetical protein COCVIDRAFT_106362 [Bipolaris victoriae FI3]|uniref:Uncharacterized protein n=1 Tax=Bipolaris victoriae (strain FI3) TaxID=930091 RepID=W7E1Q7_BIPV3|nr:hypothetical protein COCVIDRAFT_106362 [Bipolaris victoriae FI3]
MGRDISRADLSRADLRLHNIYYKPNVHQANHADTQKASRNLPDHVDAVREGLLFMEEMLPDDCKKVLEKEQVAYGDVYIGPRWCLCPPEKAFVHVKHHERIQGQSKSFETLKDCENIAESARKIAGDSAEEWMTFWKSKIFIPFSDEALQQSGFSSALDDWLVSENLSWSNFDNFVKSSLWAPKRGQPRPDLTYGFPIQTSTTSSMKGFARDELAQSFSLQSLMKLVEQSIACAPTTKLKKEAILSSGKRWKNSSRLCFPWAIVEVEKDVPDTDDVAEERCFRRAANAASAALDLQAQLFNKASDSCSLQSPPVIAFTCVGPVVKVWLAYQDKSKEFAIPIQRMVCIWSTSIELTWGVASLRAIIRNMHTWSSRLLKPRLQMAISQVAKNVHKSGHIDAQSSADLDVPTPNTKKLDIKSGSTRESPQVILQPPLPGLSGSDTTNGADVPKAPSSKTHNGNAKSPSLRPRTQENTSSLFNSKPKDETQKLGQVVRRSEIKKNPKGGEIFGLPWPTKYHFSSDSSSITSISLPKPATESPFDSALHSQPKALFLGFDPTNSSKDRSSKKPKPPKKVASNKTTPKDVDNKTFLPAVEGTDVYDLVTTFESTKLEVIDEDPIPAPSVTHSRPVKRQR